MTGTLTSLRKRSLSASITSSEAARIRRPGYQNGTLSPRPSVPLAPIPGERFEAYEIRDREPTRVPSSIQPHGFLLTLDPEGKICQSSANAAAALALPDGRLHGQNLLRAFGPSNASLVTAVESSAFDTEPRFLGAIVAPDGISYHALAHRHQGVVILEFERAPETPGLPSSILLARVSDFMAQIASASSAEEMLHSTVCEVRRLTGFDRVLIYRFDEQSDGTVIAEDRNPILPLYLDLRFPLADILSQSRELYLSGRIRSIPDAAYVGLPIDPSVNPQTGRTLDLTHSVLRGVAPAHVQHMKSMGTGASMSISILRDGELWGLISCHSQLPRRVPFETRSACDMITQLLSAQLASAEQRAAAAGRSALRSVRTSLLNHIGGAVDLLEALARHPAELLACAGAEGAAIVFEGRCRIFGCAPDENFVRQLAHWLGRRAARESVFATASLAGVFAPADPQFPFQSVAAGIAAVSISALHDSYLIWFRPETIHTIRWGRDPRVPFDPEATLPIRTEHIRDHSLPWSPAETDSAAELGHAVTRIALRKAEELARLSGDLLRSNQELEAFSYSVSHDLRAPFRHIAAFSELLRESDAKRLSDAGRRYLTNISDSAAFAGTLVDNLLSFSQMGRTALHYTQIDSLKLVEEAKAGALSDEPGRSVEWRIGPLPRVCGDLFLLRRVFQNLISNALKFTRPREQAIIEILASRGDGETIFTVRDNGVGFDPRYAEKLFGVFQRLHRAEDFEGIGIGLANVRRIVKRHGGAAWAVGTLDHGATFSFSIPDSVEINEHE